MLKLEKALFYLFIFCLPFGLRKILYSWDSFNEWNAVYLYMTDILFFLVLFLWFWRKRKSRFFKNAVLKGEGIKSPLFWLCLFLLTGLFSLVLSDNFWLGLYRWLKLLEAVFLFLYLKRFVSRSSGDKISWVLVLSGLFQSVVTILQYGNQSALGLKWLGESPIDVNVGGIAKIAVDGIKMVRAYGILPHSNILAGFLLLALFSFYRLCFKSPGYRNSSLAIFSVTAGYGLLLIGLFLSFTRSAIAVFLAASLTYFILLLWRAGKSKNKQLAKKVFFVLFLLIVYLSLFTFFAWPEISSRFAISADEQSVSLRLFYNRFALILIRTSPWLGFGFGNFVWQIKGTLNLLPSWAYQPVHNIYLLIVCETGLIGLVLFLMFLWRVLAKKESDRAEWLFVLACFLFLGTIDHYFWTIWQGQIIFWLTLGLLAAKSSKKKNDVLR